MKQFIKNSIPDSLKSTLKSWFQPKPSYGWFGDFATWKEAGSKCTGYDNAEILKTVKAAIMKVKNGEAAYERDSVLFSEIQKSQGLLDAFQQISNENRGSLHVVDFGGSLGSTYFQNRNFLKGVNPLQWSIVEQKHFVDCGKESVEGEQLKFYYTIDEALKRDRANVLLMSSVIQYFEKPYELIQECLDKNFDYILVDRTAFLDSEKERITVQVVPESIYKASYPSWFFNEKKFVNAFTSKYELVNTFDSKFDPREKLEDGIWSYRKGFLFKKIESGREKGK